MPEAKDEFPQPPWYQAAMWTGADFWGLLRILNSNGWRVSPGNWAGCAADLGFGLGNSTLGALQSLLYRSRVEDVTFERDPVFVIGHWRTGTTLMHELLALDSRHTYPTTYQCFMPCHFLLSERLLKPWTEFALPANRPPDQMRTAWDAPQEDEFALCNLGIPSPYAMIAFPNNAPLYSDYFTLEDVSAKQRERWKRVWLKFLKAVELQKPGRMVLKSPTHTFRLPLLLETFPNARFINMVRHPTMVFLSTVRLWKSLFTTHSYQSPRFADLDEFVLSTFAQMHERLETTRELVPAGRLIDVRYEDVVNDLSGTTQLVYELLELDNFDRVKPLVQDYVDSHRDYKPNQHQATSEVASKVYSRWRSYFDRYGYSELMPTSVSG